MSVIRHPGVAQTANQDGVEGLKRLVSAGRNRLAGAQVMVGPPGEEMELDPADRSENPLRFGDYLRADPVARDDCNPLFHAAACYRTRGWHSSEPTLHSLQLNHTQATRAGTNGPFPGMDVASQ
jgi:hypothetical protein